MNRLGTTLVAAGRIRPDQLLGALARQAEQGGYLGQHLVDDGALSRRELHAALAHQWGLVPRDLVREPPEADVLDLVDVDDLAARGWMPCSVDPAGVVVATTVRPGPDLDHEVADLFPRREITYVACTRRDLDRTAAHHRRHPGLATAEEGAHRVEIGTSVRHILGSAGAVALLTLGPPALSAAALAVSGVLLVLVVLAQCCVAVLDGRPGAVRAGGSPSGVADDLFLPVYTVLVPVAGEHGAIERAIENLTALDYPRSRLDAVLLVADDPASRDEVRRSAPPSWVRVVETAATGLVATLDEGLSAARGRYVVAYTAQERPDAHQLRGAVEEFEKDLAANLADPAQRPALAGLRTARLRWGRGSSWPSMAESLTETMVLDRSFPWRGTDVLLRRDLTSVHCNTHVLRTLGGWRAVTGRGSGTSSPAATARVGILDSTSHRARQPGPHVLEHHVMVLRTALGRERDRLRRGDTCRSGPLRWIAADVALGLLLPAFLLLPALASGAALAFWLRSPELSPAAFDAGLIGLAALPLGLLVATVVAGALAAWRQGWTAGLQALLLPATWLLLSVAACRAVVLLSRAHPLAAAAPAGAAVRARGGDPRGEWLSRPPVAPGSHPSRPGSTGSG